MKVMHHPSTPHDVPSLFGPPALIPVGHRPGTNLSTSVRYARFIFFRKALNLGSAVVLGPRAEPESLSRLDSRVGS